MFHMDREISWLVRTLALQKAPVDHRSSREGNTDHQVNALTGNADAAIQTRSVRNCKPMATGRVHHRGHLFEGLHLSSESASEEI